jgi:hypothetical protein
MFFLLAAFGFQALAQDINKLETPYEKARAALADSAVAAIMRNDIQLTLQIGLAMNNMKENEWSEWKQLEFMEQVIATAWGAYQWGEPETYSDLRAFQRIGPACEEYARKRDALEKTKTPLDIEREERRNYVPPAGALSTVLLKTREGFSKLMKKGEYEKKAQFRQRIAETGLEIFDSIAYTYCWQYALVSARNGQMNYDVENELDSLCLWHSENNKMLATCHMSPEMAQRVSKEKKNFLVETMKVCVVNGEVLPYKIAMATDEEQWMYEFHPLAKNTVMDTNIVFSVAKTGITDTNILQVMGDHVFDYNNHMTQLVKKEQERIAKEKERKAQEELEERLAKRLWKFAGTINTYYFRVIENESFFTRYNESYFSRLAQVLTIENVYSSVLNDFMNDFEKEFGMKYDDYRQLFQSIKALDDYNYSEAREYVRKKHTTENDIERLEWMYSKKYMIEQYHDALEQVGTTLVLLNELYKSDFRLYLLKLKKGRKTTSSYGLFGNMTSSSSPTELIKEMDNLKNGKYTSTAYAMLIEFIVNENKEASKEWGKRKDKYKDIVEFYEHYISEDYKPRK